MGVEVGQVTASSLKRLTIARLILNHRTDFSLIVWAAFASAIQTREYAAPTAKLRHLFDWDGDRLAESERLIRRRRNRG
jgi:hypothetical protein